MKINQYLALKRILTINILGFLLMLGILIINPTQTYADISSLTVTPLIENSDVTNKFQLIVKPGESRVLKFSITNFDNSSQTVTIQPTNATTSSTGQIIYERPVPRGENDLKYSFAGDIADARNQKTIKIKSQETKDIALRINIPNERFSGLILGGYRFFEGGDSSQAVSVPVYITETNKAVGGVLILKGLSAAATNQQPYLYANLSNNQPGLMNNVSVHMTVERKGIAEFFHLGLKPLQADQEYKNIAPNSTVPVAFNQKQTPIKAGTYVVNGSATSGKTHWKFSGKYHISKQQADKVNKSSRNLIYDKTWIFLLVILGVVLLIVIILTSLHFQSKKAARGNSK
ncbi:DUF916 domain-containing protein [Lactobacillus sp. CC-MHH1034]|uniref:WxL protein peptidoglycan domain-containing protein n=1 Tax=Agrilactobacillus fermenti TaxID=2586909 RepID=UPI001E490CB4|nr:DUF916 domain-containing protein [Agrilactobacillus fermenti]MCD2256952.1 DUF916 domain-containing protein [Agrilactobacillus fermenti]